MRPIRGKRMMVVGVLLGIVVQVVAGGVAGAYTGGPVEAYIVGVEPAEQKVFYLLFFRDESGRPPQIWFFDLDADNPTRPERERSLERDDEAIRPEDGSISEAWTHFLPRLRRLGSPRDYDLGIEVKADSAGVDTLWGSTRYDARLIVRALGRSRALDLTIFCDAFIHARGLYEIPGRSEVIVVVTYKGQAYGCDLVDLPILIPTE
jgi:hypothetical protein